MKHTLTLLAALLLAPFHAAAEAPSPLGKPLVADRIVFNWHNFLSGCSTWNLADWNRWTDDAQKLRYNAIMVHAYGNNPMAGFTFKGTPKPVGYLSTTVKGRDWSTMHVNDVRRLWGGEVFDGPVFGADAGMVPDDQRVAAAQALMQGVFAHAAERGMGVVFAVDVDRGSENPPELIGLLAESARFKAGGIWYPNPDTSEGYAFFRAEVSGLMKTYPQITRLAVWFRRGGSPLMDLKVADMPPAWQNEWAGEIARAPAAEKEWKAPGLFAISKIVRAFDRALKECGATHTRLAAGTWGFEFLSAADRFFPKDVALIGLDYDVLREKPQLGAAESRAALREVAARRPVIPIIWAHHDDGHYIGPPYTPFSEFYSKLADAKASGFGIIHWTTRPLDLFFTSHARQVFEKTKDEPLRATCEHVGGKALGEYLYRWVTEAPRFGRETADLFIDRPLTNIAEVVSGCAERLKLIEKIDAAALTPAQRTQLDYFKGLEQFIAAFFQAHGEFQEANAALNKRDLAAARAALAACKAGTVIEQFAKFSSIGGITRGEQGLVVSMNTRWLPPIVRLRQHLGMEPVRYKFGPTSHDPLAQLPGGFTFHFDEQRRLWQTLGTKETGAETFLAPAATHEICRSGIESDKPIVLALGPIFERTKKPATMPAGDYRLRVLMLDPTSTAAGQRAFSIAVRIGDDRGMERLRFDPVKARYLRLACHGNSQNDWNSIEEVALDSLANDGSGPAITASHELKDHPAAAAADGTRKTRWAARGRDEWIQFRLDPRMATDSIGIAWFGDENRKAKFEILVSDDGRQWKPVSNLQPGKRAAAPKTLAERVDVFAETGGRQRVLERVFDVTLPAPGRVMVTLTPLKGKALVCGVVLEPVSR
jgi:hypothetical protein